MMYQSDSQNFAWTEVAVSQLNPQAWCWRDEAVGGVWCRKDGEQQRRREVWAVESTVDEWTAASAG